MDRPAGFVQDGPRTAREDTPITATTAIADRPPRAGATARIGLVGTLVQMTFGWGFTFAYALLAIAIGLLTLGRFSTWLTPLFLRVWARVMLFIQRVDLTVEGTEHIRDRAMRVMVFNHTSLLDAMIVTAVQPIGGVPAIKREVLRIPLVGWALWALGFLLIDRGRTERAKQVLARAAERMEREQLTVIIAPEGTRSPDGSLQAFKKGAFHIARVSGAPVVPMLIDGAHEIHPLGSPVSHPGLARVRFLPPIPTDGLTVETLGDFADHVREVIRQGLEEMRADAE